jgi:hypothetical protein
MKIYPELLSNLAARIDMRTSDPALPPAQRSSVGGSLVYFYGVLALAKGAQTSPEDARNAWLMWLASQGGEPASEDTIGQISDFDRRVADGIVDAARYLQEDRVVGGTASVPYGTYTWPTDDEDQENLPSRK